MLHSFLIAALAVAYITFVLCYSKIAQPIRNLVYGKATDGAGVEKCVGNYFNGMLECPFCTGFWVSVAVQALIQNPVLGTSFQAYALVVPALALVGAVGAKVAGAMIGKTTILPAPED